MDLEKSQIEGSDTLLRRVRGEFIRKGTTLAEYCRANGIDPANAHRILRGQRNGPTARKQREAIAKAAGTHQ
jgi:gp16 family phage-associated protein